MLVVFMKGVCLCKHVPKMYRGLRDGRLWYKVVAEPTFSYPLDKDFSGGYSLVEMWQVYLRLKKISWELLLI